MVHQTHTYYLIIIGPLRCACNSDKIEGKHIFKKGKAIPDGLESVKKTTPPNHI